MGSLHLQKHQGSLGILASGSEARELLRSPRKGGSNWQSHNWLGPQVMGVTGLLGRAVSMKPTKEIHGFLKNTYEYANI